MLEQHNRQSIKSLIIFGSGLAYVLSIVMMEVLVGFALGDISESPLMQALVGIGILGTFISACLIPLALHYWLAPGTQFIVGILFWLVDVAVLAINATTSYQLIKKLELSSFFTMWQLAIPFIGPAITIIGWGLVYLADDGQKDRQSDRLLETSKRALMREAEYARVSAEHEFAMKQIAQVKQSLMMALQASDIAKVAEQGAYNSALQITRQIVGLPLNGSNHDQTESLHSQTHDHIEPQQELPFDTTPIIYTNNEGYADQPKKRLAPTIDTDVVQPDTSCITPQSLADLPLTLANESADTNDFATDTNDFEQLPLLFDEFNILEWRREIKERGKYWQWRKGSGDYRPSRYGGTFDQLDDERKAQYAVNKHIYGRNRAAQTQAQEKESDTNQPNQSAVQTSDTNRSAGDVAQRDRLLPDQRRTIEVQPESSRITPSA